MARPRKNTKAGKAATEKWRKTMAEKYGDVSKKMASSGRIGGQNGCGPDYKGGFAASHERAVKAGAKGGRKSRRLPAQRDNNGNAIKKDGTPYKKGWKNNKALNEDRLEQALAGFDFEEMYKELLKETKKERKKGFFKRLFRR